MSPLCSKTYPGFLAHSTSELPTLARVIFSYINPLFPSCSNHPKASYHIQKNIKTCYHGQPGSACSDACQTEQTPLHSFLPLWSVILACFLFKDQVRSFMLPRLPPSSPSDLYKSADLFTNLLGDFIWPPYRKWTSLSLSVPSLWLMFSALLIT